MFTVNYGALDFDKLVVYGDGVVFIEKERDIFKLGTLKDNGTVHTSYGDMVTSFNLSGEPKNARKVNLFRKDNYLVKYESGYYLREKKTALYIHISEVDCVNLGEFVAFQHDGEKDYLFKYSLTFKHGATARVVCCDRLKVAGDWTIPESEHAAGAHWKRYLGDFNNSYDTVSADDLDRINAGRVARGLPELDYNLVHWYYVERALDVNYYTSEGYHKIEKDAARSDREKIAAAFNKVLNGDKLSHYDIDKLLTVANITLK